MSLVISGIFIHLILLLSIFDIYFKSPIINDVSPCKSESEAPAKRLVLFVADGFRAESLMKSKATAYEDMKELTPFLSEIIKTQGAWGISHTHVPTESRPGHIALASGFYEDPSAVTKGWKENTVEFDSVFNQSTYSWAWGSPDIVPIFAKGTSKNHVFFEAYSSEEQDFSGKQSTTLLDTWVFDKVEEFFNKTSHNSGTLKKLHENKIIFFLHLLGLDTAGHVHKPDSKEYIENINVVDDGVKRMEKIFESFYKDNNTVYIFTADHGMTDWGSHGAGSLSETETPFIVWGAGIKKNPKPVDIEQADIAPFMATLIGVPIPVNSLGVLPIQYLDVPEKDKAKMLFSNACQMGTQFDEKRRRTEKDVLKILYTPFPHLNHEMIQDSYREIKTAIAQEEYQKAINISQRLIQISMEGLDYYQNYHQYMLLACTTLSYLGWIVLLLINILKTSFDGNRSKNITQNIFYEYANHKILHLMFGIMIVIVTVLLYVQNLPYMYYLHCNLPVLLWWNVAINCRRGSSKLLEELRNTKSNMELIIWVTIYLIGIEILVLSFFERKILSLALVGISLWPFITKSREINIYLKTSWLISCLGLSIFPFLPVIGSNYNTNIVVLAGLIWIVLHAVFIYVPYLSNQDADSTSYNFLANLYNVFLVITLLNIYMVEQSLSNKEGLPLLNQICSWTLLFISFLLPMCGSLYITHRLLNIKLASAIPVILLSVNYEPMFILVLFANLFIWLIMEHQLSSEHIIKLTEMQFKEEKTNILRYVRGDENLSASFVQLIDFRRTYFFLLYIILAFFGTGNIASINSFDTAWVRNFFAVYNPFGMGILILIKIILPFLVVSCTFRAVTLAVRAPIRQVFMIVLMFGDVMGLQFLYLVKNKGSWLEIGQTISHFVIAQSIVVFLMLLYCLAIVLTQWSLPCFKLGGVNKIKKI